jgi:hypothetical protein
MRAAFRVALAGRQVAVLCPTTVLAQQHFQSFLGRMQSYPVRIERSVVRTNGRSVAVAEGPRLQEPRDRGSRRRSGRSSGGGVELGGTSLVPHPRTHQVRLGWTKSRRLRPRARRHSTMAPCPKCSFP